MATVPQGIVGKPRFGPSDCLIAMLRACSRDSTEAIQTRLKCMLQMFLQHYRDDEGNEKTKELAAKCCYEAGVWYHRILENLISQERKRLGFSDISGILEHDLFQRCLVACCLEIAVTSNSLPCDFPLLLQILKLAPYHFWKVIEPVWRVGSGLPHYVVTHLVQVEEKVLENLAWISDSPLWDEITPNEGHMPTCQQVMHPNRLEGPMQTDPGVPRVDVSLGMNHSARTEQQCSPSAINRQERSSSLHLFARKVYSLMAKRLRELCSTLEISDELRLKIWTCFEYSLVHCSCLMVDHHLDQLLMCAIYIIAKITKMEIPFKQIMKCYKSQPRANKSVCKNVLISERMEENSTIKKINNGKHSSTILTPNTPSTHYPRPGQEERGNLIHFYNQVYTTKMQHFAKQFAQTSLRDTPPLSPYPRQWKASPRCYQLSNSPSISISPYNTETPSPHRTGLCYYFNSSPPELLREINNMIKTGRSPNVRCYAVSLDRDELGDGSSAKRLCLDGQSAWQRRLRNVFNDRITRMNQDQV